MRYLIFIIFSLWSSWAFASAPKNFIIDTDVGIDDAIAILYLLKQPDVQVAAITIEADGDSHCKPGLNNVKKFLQLTHHENIPVACGRATPLQGSHKFPKLVAEESDTLAGLMPEHPNINVPKQTAVNLLSSTLRSATTPITILAIGPLTNIAELLEQQPELKNKISRIYQMGGAVRVEGNIRKVYPHASNHVAEWNIYFDPLAAEKVFHSGVRITLVPLDITNTVLMDKSFYQQFQKNHRTPEANFVFELLKHNNHMLAAKVWYFWDPMTAVIALHPDLASYETLPITVKQFPEKMSGATAIDNRNGAEMQVATKIDGKIVKNSLRSTLQGALA